MQLCLNSLFQKYVRNDVFFQKQNIQTQTKNARGRRNLGLKHVKTKNARGRRNLGLKSVLKRVITP